MRKFTKVRKILCTMLIAVMAAGLLTGCQETPDSPVVKGKDQEQMLNTAANGGENSSPLLSFTVPERFTGDWSGVDGCVTVHADADIELPTVSAIPTGRLERRSFTQEDADRILAAFIGDNTLYKERTELTKQEIKEILDKAEAILRGEAPPSLLIDPDTDRTVENYIPGLIESMTEKAKTAPDENDPYELASRSFGPPDDLENWQFAEGFSAPELVQGWAEVDGRKYYIYMCKEQSGGYSDSVQCQMEGFGYGRWGNNEAVPYSLLDMYEEAPEESISGEDAIKMGNELMESLGLANVVCDKSTQIAFIENFYTRPAGSVPDIIETGYELQYVRCLEGMPISYTPFTGNVVQVEEAYLGGWHYERITVDVTGSGIVYFEWESPYTEPTVETRDTQLLDFEDVADIFGKMIIVKHSDLKEQNARNNMRTTYDFHVDHVELGLMRIRSKGNINQGLLVPVWDFWGTWTVYPGGNTSGWEEYTIFLTVNAIDGTIIDREYGY